VGGVLRCFVALVSVRHDRGCFCFRWKTSIRVDGIGFCFWWLQIFTKFPVAGRSAGVAGRGAWYWSRGWSRLGTRCGGGHGLGECRRRTQAFVTEGRRRWYFRRRRRRCLRALYGVRAIRAWFSGTCFGVVRGKRARAALRSARIPDPVTSV